MCSRLQLHVSGFSYRCRRCGSDARCGECLGRTEPIPPRKIVDALRDGETGSVGPGGGSVGAVGRGDFTLPLQVVYFALVGPVLWLFGVAVPYGVVADVIPFLTVTLPTSKLAIPEMPLP